MASYVIRNLSGGLKVVSIKSESGNTIQGTPEMFDSMIEQVGAGNISQLYIQSTVEYTSLPERIGELVNLKLLNIYANQLRTLPDSIGNLIQLESIYLDENNLTKLPDTIGNLVNLTTLSVYKNKLTRLPETIGNLVKLTSLYIYNNRLTEIPEIIGNLTKIHTFPFYENELTSLPESIGNLTKLRQFNCWDNKLTSLPNTIGNLVNLQRIRLEFNKLSSLPDTIGNLTNVRIINCSDNKLTTLPESIGNLVNLTELHVRDNELINLPESIGNLTRLLLLNCRNNEITALPESIGNMRRLEVLSLSHNQLTTLPSSIWNLNNLSDLFVSNNQLTALPEITNPDGVSLSELRIANNPLERLPDSFTNISFYEIDIELDDPVITNSSLAVQQRIQELFEEEEEFDDEEMPEAIAFEIHHAFDNFDKETYNNYLSPLIAGYQPTYPILNKYSVEVHSYQLKNLMYSTMTYLLSKYTGDKPVDGDDGLRAGMERIFADRIAGMRIEQQYHTMILNTLMFIAKIDYQPLTNLYIESYVIDCVHAYQGPDGMSCAAGSVERVFLNFFQAVKTLCCMADCGVPALSNMCSVINLSELDSNNDLFNSYLQEWTQQENEGYEGITAIERKNMLVHFLVGKYMGGLVNEELASTFKERIQAKLGKEPFNNMNFKCNDPLDTVTSPDDCEEDEGHTAKRPRGRGGGKIHNRIKRITKKYRRNQQRKTKPKKHTRKPARKPARKQTRKSKPIKKHARKTRNFHKTHNKRIHKRPRKTIKKNMRPRKNRKTRRM